MNLPASLQPQAQPNIQADPNQVDATGNVTPTIPVGDTGTTPSPSADAGVVPGLTSNPSPTLPASLGGNSQPTQPSAPNIQYMPVSSSNPLDSPQGLLSLANQQGGTIAEAANAIANPQTSLLSAIGNDLGSAFQGFVNTISIPSEAVAGALKTIIGNGDSNLGQNINDAITQHIMPDQVLFGGANPDDTTMEKIGGFVVRTATDILFDPLTYVTFGAGEGVFGLRAASKITLGTNAAAYLGADAADSVALSGEGQELYTAVKGVENDIKGGAVHAAVTTGDPTMDALAGVQAQSDGTAMARLLESGKPAYVLAGKSLQKVLANTIDSPFNVDFAKKAISNMLEQQPALADTLLDKGGIKAFGNTIVSAQRISSVIKMVPGMTLLDHMTSPVRDAVQALFDPSMVKADGVWYKTPEETNDIFRTGNDLAKSLNDSRLKNFGDIVKANKLNANEASYLTAAVEADKMPADARLANAFTQLKNYNAKELQFMRASGYPIAKIDNHIPHTLVKSKTTSVPFKTSGTGKAVAAIERKLKGPIMSTYEHLAMDPETSKLADIAKDSKNVDEFVEKIKNQTDSNAKKVFFGGDKYDANSVTEQGISVATKSNSTKPFVDKFTLPGEEKLRSAKPQTLHLSSNAKVMPFNEIPKEFLRTGKDGSIFPKAKATNGLDDISQEILPYAKSKGYDAIDLRKMGDGSESEIRVINPKVLSDTDKKIPLPSGFDAAKFFKQANTTMSDVEKEVLGKDADQGKITQMFHDITNAGFEGFDKNAVTALARRSFDNVRAGVSRQFMRAVAEQAGVEATEAPKGWRALTTAGMTDAGRATEKVVGKDADGNDVMLNMADILGNVKGQDGADLLYHPAVAKRIESFVGSMINDDATQGFLKAYDSITNMFKASVTEMFPAFHGRNAISNVFLHYLDLGVHSLDPVLHTMAGDMVLKDRQLRSLQTAAVGLGEKAETAQKQLAEILNKTYFTDRSGYQWTYGELRAVIKSRNVAFTHSVTTPADIEDGAVNLDKTLFPEGLGAAGKVQNIARKSIPYSRQFVGFKAGGAVGNALQEQARLVDFMANLKATGDVELAASRSKQFIFDHSYLTPFEKNVMRRLIPFYAFTRKNLEAQARALITTPGRVAAETGAVSTLGDILSGNQQLTPQQKAALPDWLRSGQELLVGQQGNTVQILGDFGFPVEQPFLALQPNQILGSLAPQIRIPLEEASGYSLFQGKPLSQVTNATAFVNAPQVVKDAIGFTTYQGKTSDGRAVTYNISLNPEVMNLLLNLPPITRVFSSLSQLDTEDTTGQQKIMQQLLGVKVYSFDWEKEAAKRSDEQKAALEQLLTNAGVVGTFTTPFKPKAKI